MHVACYDIFAKNFQRLFPVPVPVTVRVPRIETDPQEWMAIRGGKIRQLPLRFQIFMTVLQRKRQLEASAAPASRRRAAF